MTGGVDPKTTGRVTRCVVATVEEVTYDQAIVRMHALDGHRFPFLPGTVLWVYHDAPGGDRDAPPDAPPPLEP